MSQKTEFILSAKDETKAAFDAVNGHLSRMTGSSVNLASSFKNIGMAATGLAGAGTVAAFTAQIGAAITAMGDLKDAAESTGASVENLSALKSVAKLTGIEFGSITDSINRLSKSLHGTDDESKGAGKALAALGLDVKKLRDMDPAEAFIELSRAQEKFADGGGKTSALMAILGKNAASVIPYMKDLAEQQKLVGKVTAEQAIAADEYGKNLVRLQASWGSLARTVASESVPVLNELTKAFLDSATAVNGIKGATDGLAKNGQLAEWAENSARAAAFVIDAFDGVQRVVRLSGIGIGGLAASAQAALSGNLNGASSILNQLRDDADSILMSPQFSDRLNKRFDEMKTLPLRYQENAKAVIKAYQGYSVKIQREAMASLTEAYYEGSTPKSKSLNSMKFGAGGISKEKESKESAEATDAAKEYAKAMQALAGTSLDATSAQMELSKTQKIMLDLMQSPTFATMPDTWKATAVAQFEVARATEMAAEEQARLNKLLGETDTGKIEAARKDMELLAKVFEDGRISEEAYLEAVQKRLGDAGEKTKEANDAAKELGMTFSSAFEEAVIGGKKAGDVMKSLAMDIGKIILRKNVTEPMANAIAGINWGSLFSGLAANAKGGVYDSASLSAYSGRVVSSPTMFAFARGAGVMGEAGPEAILPLKRGADGKLGVASGGNAPVVNINIRNEGAADGYQATATTRQNGASLDIDVLVVKAIQNDQRRNGPITQSLANTFGLNRSAA